MSIVTVAHSVSENQPDLFAERPHDESPEQRFVDRLLNLQFDIWRLEAEQARVSALLRMRRAARQQLAREARQASAFNQDAAHE